MQIWLESGARCEGVDLLLGEDLLIEGGELRINGRAVGRAVDASSSEGQARARAMAGSVEWILLELGDWKMIPIENLVAACDGGPTRVAARVAGEAAQIQGAAFALEKGVDALLVPPALLEAALVAKAQRGEKAEAGPDAAKAPRVGAAFEVQFASLEVIEVESGGVGDRVCVDLTSLLDIGEGMLVGSSAASMVLVHGETVPSEFVPTRPFRVNAGAVHCYILMADGSTKYLSELKMGDEVLVVSARDRRQRSATVGRTKVERRPLTLLRWRDRESGKEAGTFVQQAETIRVVEDSAERTPIPITELRTGALLAGWCSSGGRHVGMSISTQVVER